LTLSRGKRTTRKTSECCYWK